MTTSYFSGTGTNGPGTTGPAAVPSKQAAAILGITDRAVRKRIAAGTLRGELVNGAWYVYLGEQPEQRNQRAGSSSPSGNRNRNSGTTEAPTLAPQLSTVMDQWLVPLITQIGDLREELGRERVLREQAEQLVEDLKRQLARTAKEPVPELGPEPPAQPMAPPPAPERRRYSLRERLAAYLAGRPL